MADLTNSVPPTLKPGMYNRPRLNALLAQATAAPFTSIVAGAGYGKTQAVSMYIREAQVRSAWIHLIALNNYQESFWRKFLSEVAFQNQENLQALTRLGFPDTNAKFEQFLRVFAREVYAGDPFILVFDDLHALDNEVILKFIQNLIHAGLENACVVLISRTRVDSGFAGLYSGQWVRQIDADDLRFTHEETAAYLQQQELALSPADIERIQTATDGWPFALYLTGLSLRSGEPVSDNPIAGVLPTIYELIDKEIFTHYSPEAQHILIKLSLISSFPTNLIKELSGPIFPEIMEILDSNMFISPKPHTESHVIHHLFLDFLMQKQWLLAHEEIRHMYTVTAAWCAANGYTVAALSYYQNANYPDHVWELIYNMPHERRPRHKIDFLLAILNNLPPEFVAQHQLVRVVRAAYQLNNLVLQPALDDLNALVAEQRALLPSPEATALIGEASLILGLIYLTIRDFRFIEAFKLADECLPNGSVFDYSQIKIIDSNDAIIPVKPTKADCRRMLDALYAAAPHIAKVTHGLSYGIEYLAAAELAYFNGDLRKAETEAFQCIYRAKQFNQVDIVCSAYFLLMRLMTGKGKYKEAMQHMQDLREAVKTAPDSSFFSVVDIAESWFYSKIGITDKTAYWLLDDTLNNELLSPISVGQDRLIRAYYFLEEKRFTELLAYVEQLGALYYDKGLFFQWTSVYILKMIAQYELGDPDWLDTLRHTYKVSEESGYIMQFIEMGRHVRKLADNARGQKGHGIPTEWLDMIFTKSSTYAKRLAHIRVEYDKVHNTRAADDVALTPREIAVLSDLYQGLTRDEIAASQYISPGTVKNVLNSVYSKLGAVNSMDAIRIAQNKKLL